MRGAPAVQDGIIVTPHSALSPWGEGVKRRAHPPNIAQQPQSRDDIRGGFRIVAEFNEPVFVLRS